MSFLEIFLIAVGLSADAFAVSVCKGLSVGKVKPVHYVIIGLWFGGFQALMPLIGYFFGSLFASYIEAFDHWIAFALLAFLGVKMIVEGAKKEDAPLDDSFSFLNMLVLAVATSIDALASGLAFSLVGGMNIFTSVALIGATTFVLSAAGLKAGGVFGEKFRSPAEIAGGAILILIGLKILLEHIL